MENTREPESLDAPLNVKVNINNLITDGEDVTINVTLRSKLFNSIKTKLLFIHKKIMYLVSCTTSKTVDNTQELNPYEELEKIKEPIAVELASVIKKQIALEVADVIEKQIALEVTHVTEEPIGIEVEPVIEKPISFDERL
jgi:hypothetical protein